MGNDVIALSTGQEALQSPGRELDDNSSPVLTGQNVRWFSAFRRPTGLGSFLRLAGRFIGGGWEWGHAGNLDGNPALQVQYANLASTSLLDYHTRLWKAWSLRSSQVLFQFSGNLFYEVNENVSGAGYTPTLDGFIVGGGDISSYPWGVAVPPPRIDWVSDPDPLAEIELSGFSDTAMSVTSYNSPEYSVSGLVGPIGIDALFNQVITDMLGTAINTDWNADCWFIWYHDYPSNGDPIGGPALGFGGLGVWDYTSVLPIGTGDPGNWNGLKVQESRTNANTQAIGCAALLSSLINATVVDTGWTIGNSGAGGIRCGIGQIRWQGSTSTPYWIGKLIGFDFGFGPAPGEAYFHVDIIDTSHTLSPGQIFTVPWTGIVGGSPLDEAPLPFATLPGNPTMPINTECYFLAIGTPPPGISGDHHWPT